MKYPVSRLRPARCRAGFSLVEVTLAVGIMAFALVGILGVLPLAMDSGRQSFNQARASAIANTLFTSLRSQPFNDVHYLDAQFDQVTGMPIAKAENTLDLNQRGPVSDGPNTTTSATPTDSVKLYVKFLEAPSDTGLDDDSLGSQRRLCFTSKQPTSGADYQVVMYFNNKPDGTLVSSTALNRVGQANRITLVVSAASSNDSAPLREPFRFVTTVANRLN